MKHTRFWRFALLGMLIALAVAIYNGYVWYGATLPSTKSVALSRIWSSLLGMGGLAAAVGFQFYRFRTQQEEINTADKYLLLIEPAGRDEFATSTFWHDAIGQILRENNSPSPHLGFEMVVHNGVIRFFLQVEADTPTLQMMSAEIRKAWPKTHVEIVPAEKSVHTGAGERAWCELTLKQDDKYPINLPERKDFTVARDALHRDRVADYLAALSSIKKGMAGIQILVRPAPSAAREKWTRDISRMRKKLQTQYTHVREYKLTERRKTFGVENADELKRDAATLSIRLDDTMLEVVFRVWSDLTEGEVVSQLAQQIVAASAGGRNSFKAGKPQDSQLEKIRGFQYPVQGGAILTSTELDRMVQLPGAATCQQFPMVSTAGAERLPAEAEVVVPPAHTLCTEQGLDIGRYRPTVARSTTHRAYGIGTSTSAESVMVGHRFVAAREHTFIFGPTGTGKSTLAENILLQDWLGGAGHSVLVIDPHGELVHSILRCVPRSREADVIIINPNDIQPPRINVMNINQGQEAIDKAIAHMLEGFQYAMGASWATSVGMQDVLLQGMAMVKSIDPDVSMCELEAFLDLVSAAGKDNDEKRKKELFEYSKLPLHVAGQRALNYWRKEFVALNPNSRAQSAGAAKRRVKAFLNSDEIRSTMGMKGSTVNLEEAINSGKLILVVMAEGMGEIDRKIWGTLLVREFISILKRRTRQQREQHASIVIDEMASTIGTMKEFVKEIGAELRKFGGSATLITQSYAQIPEDTIKEIKANYRTQIAFSGSPDDARIASGLFQEKVSAADIQALPRYHAYLLASIKGSQAAPCLIQCFPPAETPNEPEPVAWPYHPKWSFVLGQSDTTNGRLDDMLTLKQLEIGTRRQSRNQVMEVVDGVLHQRWGWKKLSEIYWLKQEYDIWRAESILQQPGLIPNTVERIEMLSRLRYGIPFWWSLAQYRHQYLDGGQDDGYLEGERRRTSQKAVAQKEF